jgi:peptide-methionine (S)-S-oxide reductase
VKHGFSAKVMKMDKTTGLETAVFGSGCFWCAEPVFSELRGVLDVTPGYSGGHVDNPTYEQVCSSRTGHVEVVRVRFDPAIINYETLLQVFFGTHDPTTIDRQGDDVGPQYASTVFCQSPQQKQTAERVVKEVESMVEAPVVTRLRDADRFWPAENYHNDYYTRNPNQGYCQMVISPKMAKFRRRFTELLTHI